VDDAGECKYDNLLYVCAACNEAKKAVLGLPDPCKVALSECLKISKSGRVEALNKHGEKLRQILLLDSKRNVDHRSRWIRILDALSKSDPSLHQELMGFPDDLPDLRRKRSSFNTRPTGVLNCYFVLRENDQLTVAERAIVWSFLKSSWHTFWCKWVLKIVSHARHGQKRII
jgi:hypothetical protein